MLRIDSSLVMAASKNGYNLYSNASDELVNLQWQSYMSENETSPMIFVYKVHDVQVGPRTREAEFDRKGFDKSMESVP